MIEWMILILLLLLTGLMVYLLVRQRSARSDMIDSLIKDQFLSFKDSIHSELNTTRQEVNRSKDMMPKHAIKTLETINGLEKPLSQIVQQQEEAQELERSFKDLLKALKLRGNYGEAILEEMLERVLPRNIWKNSIQ